MVLGGGAFVVFGGRCFVVLGGGAFVVFGGFVVVGSSVVVGGGGFVVFFFPDHGQLSGWPILGSSSDLTKSKSESQLAQTTTATKAMKVAMNRNLFIFECLVLIVRKPVSNR